MGQTVEVKSTLNGLTGWNGPGQFMAFPDLGLASEPAAAPPDPARPRNAGRAPGRLLR